MDNEKYYTITQSGDGDISIYELNTKEMEKQMKEWMEEDGIPTFVKTLTNYNDPMYWPENSMLIIKGHLVIPKTKKVVKELEIE